ncbi:hypothetical protein EVAR_75757_1 [Eumeta japonica]|uniref:Uncharacterized protein n=1 Tax=Eumeta variegata TaxID=151549 RepID=A0A4C1TDM6_EUMVA|nr:hypothetical protein EVAR_75757_1 [Eumeta japonica]
MFDIKDEPCSDRPVTDKVDAVSKKVEQERSEKRYLTQTITGATQCTGKASDQLLNDLAVNPTAAGVNYRRRRRATNGLNLLCTLMSRNDDAEGLQETHMASGSFTSEQYNWILSGGKKTQETGGVGIFIRKTEISEIIKIQRKSNSVLEFKKNKSKINRLALAKFRKAKFWKNRSPKNPTMIQNFKDARKKLLDLQEKENEEKCQHLFSQMHRVGRS